MLDVGLDVPVSAELHSVFQIDIRRVAMHPEKLPVAVLEV